MIRKLICILIALSSISVLATAETGYKANTDVYVRSASDGRIVGMFEEDDAIPVTEKHGGWYYFEHDEHTYKVWAEYVSEFEVDDSAEKSSPIKKSKSMGEIDKNGVYKNTIKKKKISKSSPFSDINPF